ATPVRRAPNRGSGRPAPAPARPPAPASVLASVLVLPFAVVLRLVTAHRAGMARLRRDAKRSKAATGRRAVASGAPRRSGYPTPNRPSRPRRRLLNWHAGNPRQRLVAVLAVVAIAFTVVLVRLIQLQLVGGDRFVELGDAQRVRLVGIPAPRGTIFDRDGNDLAISAPQRTVWADPAAVTNPAAAARALAPLLGLDPAALEATLLADSRFEYLARQVSDDIASRVDALGVDGIHLIEEQTRFNPGRDLAGSVLGRVNIDGEGSAGLELQYNERLAGTQGQLVVERDPDGRTIAAGDYQLEQAVAGTDLVLTVDRAMQHEIERMLAEHVVAVGGQAGSAIVADTDTGEILALANVGTTTAGAPPGLTTENRALTSVFEPGSVNKVVTMAAAVEEGVVSPESMVTVPVSLQVYDKEFVDGGHDAPVQWTPTDILTRSSNVGTILMGQRLGPERLDRYLRDFGFGDETAIGFPNESPGLLPTPDDYSGTSLATIAMGQGISVTAMQMLAAYNTIANGGVYVAPKLVRASIDAAGNRVAAPPSAHHRVVSEDTAGAVQDMMTYVVEEGTGRRAQIDGYLAAGKTGTARKPLPGGGYTDENGRYHYVATFAGFVPADDPQLTIIVVIDEPGTSIYASQVAAPLFARMATYALRHERIPPSVEQWAPNVPAPGEGPGRAPEATTDGRDEAEIPTGATADDPTTVDDVAPRPRDTG
ncbi:MAG: peptidoglycan D,D-transpeptidase FtsI family protein, partial [Acidimicrobiales bacterium]